jgi:hypothetical protein
MNPGAMKTNKLKNRALEVSFIRPATDALTPVESEDLSRFEGEGGPEAPMPELVDIPLNNAIWRRPPHVTHPLKPKEMSP